MPRSAAKATPSPHRREGVVDAPVREVAPADVLRAAAQAAVDASSLRTVAVEIGVSFSGLRSFLAGGRPYLRTQRRLSTWYVRKRVDDHDAARSRGDEINAATAAGALALLLAHIPTAHHRTARADIVRAISAVTIAAGAPPPGWLIELGRPQGG